MSAKGLLLLLLPAVAVAEDWSLADHIDNVLMYDALTYAEYGRQANHIQGAASARLMRTATLRDGELVPYLDGMQVDGELRQGQMLISPDSLPGAWAELVVTDGTKLNFQFGLCDNSRQKHTRGITIDLTLLKDGQEVGSKRLSLTENRWQTDDLALPGGEVLIRMFVRKVGAQSANWVALVMTGDGALAPLERVRELSPDRDKIGTMSTTPKPTNLRVTAKPGYDNLFYDGHPFISYATKGHTTGTEEQQQKVGANLYYREGNAFTRYWNEKNEAAGVVVPENSNIALDLAFCQRAGMPYKTALSFAHCVPFLPDWLVSKYHLEMEQHQIRQGGATHASFIKAKTEELYKRGLEGFIKPWIGQPAIFVFGQEDEIDLWDDQGAESQGKWRAWLRKRFGGDFQAFSDHVGGVQGATGFDQAPYLKQFEHDPAYGYPHRAACLKLQWQVDEYAAFLKRMKDYVHGLAPEVPLTQRYVADPCGRAISKLVGFDYNYCYGHLSEEGTSGRYGSGKKIWTGIYGHCMMMPYPRGGSIGLTVSREIRRGQMTEQQWALNAYTQVANGSVGFEASPFLGTWGPAWEPGALMNDRFELTPSGQASRQVMTQVLALAPYLEHHDRFEDVAVYHDETYQCRPPLGTELSASKVGGYTLIRELGYQPDPLTAWDMTADNLRGRKVLMLFGSVPLAPEIQSAIRDYVRSGGLLLACYTAQGAGFPGCNGYEFTGPVATCATERSFDDPASVCHLGDVLGLTAGGGALRRKSVQGQGWSLDLSEFNALVDEGRWVNEEACCATLSPAADAEVLARFDDGSPAMVAHAFGQGRAITFGFDPGLIAGNLTPLELYRALDAMLAARGCRKVFDTGSYFVESGQWHNDRGQRLLILINHDDQRAHTVKLPDGKSVAIAPGAVHCWKSGT